jgi:AmmeMemoRadiSam system protein B
MNPNEYGVRIPAVAGQFYPESSVNLKSTIEKLFGEFTNENYDSFSFKKKALAFITPHAGLFFSGKCQATAYFNILKIQKPTTFIVMGPNHTGIGCSSISLKDFDTPLGIIKNDQLISKEIVSKGIVVDEVAHKFEHSIEMQVIFLKYLSIKNNVDFRIVPVILGSKEDAVLISSQIKEYLRNDVIFIVSSDFIHYGPDYNYAPFGPYKKEIISRYEQKAIERIVEIDPNGFIECVSKDSLTICGIYPILCLLETLNPISQKIESKRLCYYHSADILPSKNSVSYVAIGFFNN